jgi:transcriptional regulator with XRE-family HTH domain
VSTKSSLIQKLKKSKEYRDAFVASQISTGIPFQIRALREQHGLSQKDLAKASAMLQPRICSMEQAGYGNFTLNTLKKLAVAFDVGLVVRFAPYGELVQWADNFTPDTFRIPTAQDDPVLNRRHNKAELQSDLPESQPLKSIPESLNKVSESTLLRDAALTSNSSTSVHAPIGISASLLGLAETANRHAA